MSLGGKGAFFRRGMGGTLQVDTMHYFLCMPQATMHAGWMLQIAFKRAFHKSALALIDIISSFEDSDPSDTSVRL